jgi:hypothetical protein
MPAQKKAKTLTITLTRRRANTFLSAISAGLWEIDGAIDNLRKYPAEAETVAGLRRDYAALQRLSALLGET